MKPYKICFEDDLLCRSYVNGINSLYLKRTDGASREEAVATPKELLQITGKHPLSFYTSEKTAFLCTFLKELAPLLEGKSISVNITVLKLTKGDMANEKKYKSIHAFLEGEDRIKEDKAPSEAAKETTKPHFNTIVLFPLEDYKHQLKETLPDNSFYFAIKKGTAQTIPDGVKKMTNGKVRGVLEEDVLPNLFLCKQIYLLGILEKYPNLFIKVKDYGKKNQIILYENLDHLTKNTKKAKDFKKTDSIEPEQEKEPAINISPPETKEDEELPPKKKEETEILVSNQEEILLYRRKLMRAYQTRIYLYIKNTAKITEDKNNRIKSQTMDLISIMVRFPKDTDWKKKKGKLLESLNTIGAESIAFLLQRFEITQLKYLWKLCYHLYVTSIQLYSRDEFFIEEERHGKE